MSTAEKKCMVCPTIMRKGKDESRSNWEKRETCGRACAGTLSSRRMQGQRIGRQPKKNRRVSAVSKSTVTPWHPLLDQFLYGKPLTEANHD